MEQIIAIIDLVGTFFFILAAVYSIKNYKKTFEQSEFWIIYLISSILGAVWSFSVALEWFNIYPIIFDNAQQMIAASTATAFAIAAIVSIYSLGKPTN